jgi:hypothetical protein
VRFTKYYTGDQIKEDKMGGECSTHQRDEKYTIFAGKPERKGPLGRPRERCEDDIKMDIREIEWECVDWIHLSQDRDQ